jgi:patatin-like phospholipase/acyl hydrolase
MDKNTIRVLSILGGGGRGYLANCLLKNYVKQAYGSLTKENYLKFFGMFDVICGTSIGGIMTICLALGLTPDDIDSIFTTYGKRIFTSRTLLEKTNANHNASTDSKFLGEAEKFASIEAGENFYESPYPDSNYGHNILYKLFDDKFGTKTLSSLKTKVVIPSYKADISQFVLFSNIKDNKYFTYNNDELLINVAKATSAAPFFFPPAEFGNHKYWDGGLWSNDPCEAGILAAKMIKPIHNNIVVLTVSTGMNYWGFNADDTYDSGSGKPLNLMKMKELADVAMAGSEQYTDFKLSLQSDRLMDALYSKNSYITYYKMNPFYAAELDDFSPANITTMETLANKYCADEATNMATSIGHLLA